MTRMFADQGAGIVGTGAMAATHVDALRRIGVNVVGVAGRTAARARESAAQLGLATGYDDVEALLADPLVGTVHITSPNDVHVGQARAALRAGKHVVCEKPLGVSSEESAELLALARAMGLVNAVCFTLRFFPPNRNAAGLVAGDVVGQPRVITGGYHQDWLLLETDWNWRLDSARQGELRAVADIGSHWFDMARFVTGKRVEAVFADLHTFVVERNHPRHAVRTMAAASVPVDVDRVRERLESDDAAGIMLRFEDGLRGLCSVSQVAAGRKNRLHWELNGATSSLAWDSENAESLWVGHRGRPNEVMATDPGSAALEFPAGPVQGYPDTFRAMFEAVYSDIASGGPSPVPVYPTFTDGHEVALVCDAVQESAAGGGWATVSR